MNIRWKGNKNNIKTEVYKGSAHINIENKQWVTGGVVGGWIKWVRDTKESTHEITVELYGN